MTGLRPLSPATELKTTGVPPPRASRRLRACSQNTTVLVKSTSSRRRARSTSCSSSSCRAKSPAVTTTASRPPRRASAASRAAAKPPGLSRSQGAAPTGPFPDLASRSRALRSRSARSRPRRKTSSPRAAIRRDSDRPMPRVAPRKPTFIWPARSGVISQEAHGLSAAQPSLGVPLAPDARPRGQPRLHGPEMCRAGELVLRQIDAASLGDDQLVERVDERLRLVVNRDVERDGYARFREAEQADPLGPAVLDDAEHRGAAPVREQLQEAASRPSPRRLGQHALVLREAARAVHPVPVADGVQRIEEGL